MKKDFCAMNQESSKICFFGRGYLAGKDQLIGISEKDRRNHVYVIGKTGMGKSTLLENMLISDIQKGAGVGLVDPRRFGTKSSFLRPLFQDQSGRLYQSGRPRLATRLQYFRK